MISPMLVQYLVGLCCMRRNPSAVNITLGDMVLDPVAGKKRDVDVTVTLEESPGIVQAFLAYEVKRENSPLDVAVIEQLCAKLIDMPSVTHRAIVSTSGFTDGARNKATAKGVDLYLMRPWTEPIHENFPGLDMTDTPEEVFKFERRLLNWVDFSCYVVMDGEPESFQWDSTTPIYAAGGSKHQKFPDMGAFQRHMLVRSTSTLMHLNPACLYITDPPQVLGARAGQLTDSGLWPQNHTLDVAGEDAHLKLGGKLHRMLLFTIGGMNQWQVSPANPEYYVLERVTDGHIFAGALIALGPGEDSMLALVMVPNSRQININIFRLEERHKNAIRNLELKMIRASDIEE